MKRILVTNDDGPSSRGLVNLAERLAQKYDVSVIVPDSQRSATAKALTLNKPLRVYDRGRVDGYHLITHDGTPADSVILAKDLIDEIDFVVSGINMGANLGYQSMATSGTVGAVVEAAIMGYPGIAVSRVINTQQWFHHSDSNREYNQEIKITVAMVDRIINFGLPEGIDALNINFPCEVLDTTRIIATRPIRARMYNTLDKRIDPNGSPYYWIRGHENNPEPGTDAFEVLKNGNISVSPIIIDYMNDDSLESLRLFIEQ